MDDDERDYQELLKAEAAERRDTKMVMGLFRLILVLASIGLVCAVASLFISIISTEGASNLWSVLCERFSSF